MPVHTDDGGVSQVAAAQELLKNLCRLQGIEFRAKEGNADKADTAAVGEVATGTAQASKVPIVKFVVDFFFFLFQNVSRLVSTHALNSKNYAISTMCVSLCI